MKDRDVQYPNRYYCAETGQYVTLVPAPGEVTEEGTPLNKATLLTDATAKMFLITGDLTVNNALRAIGETLPVFNTYSTDLYLYVTGQHPILSSSRQVKEYWGKYMRPPRDIVLTGEAQTITVNDGYGL